jgi:amino acid adenylation domain-containing protein
MSETPVTTTPASAFQQRIWFAEQLEPDLALYNVPLLWRLSAPLDPRALERALARVIGRHEILRTRFLAEDGSLRQALAEPWEPRLERFELGADWEAGVGSLLLGQAARRFDLSSGKLLRAGLIEADGQAKAFFVVVHHLVWDEASEGPLLAELDRCYRAEHASSAATPHQERMAFVDQFENGELYPAGPTYHNLPFLLRLAAEPEPAALAAAVAQVARRHESLRTTLAVTADGVRRQVGDEVVLPAVRLAPDEPDEPDVLSRWIEQPFDLAAGPLLRVAVQPDRDGGAVLALLGHLAVVDRASLAIVARELLVLLGGGSLPAAPLGFSRWYETRDQSAAAADLAAMRQWLSPDIAPLTLPENRTRAAVHVYAARSVPVELPASLGVPGLAAAVGTDDETVLLAGFAAVLSWYSGRRELVIGTLDDGREEDSRGVVGPLANLLAVRLDADPDSPGADLLRHTAQALDFARGHRRADFDDLVSALAPAKDMSRMALFDVLFQCVDQEPGVIETGLGHGKYDLHLYLCRDGEGGHRGHLVFNARYFDREPMERLVAHYARMLMLLAADPSALVGGLEPLGAEERALQLRTWNPTEATYPDCSLVDLLLSAATAHPDAIALTHGTQNVGYRELMEAARRRALALVELGVRPGDFVALRLPRGVAQIETILAVLLAGGVYLPVDVSTPAERLGFILNDSGARYLVLAGDAPDAVVPAGYPGRAIHEAELTSPAREATPESGQSAFAELPTVSAEAGAYCIYTSGTTGRPKGVVISHRNVVRLVVNDRLPFDFGPEDVWSLSHSYAFDFSVWELFGCLVHGGRLVVVDEAVVRDAERFRELLLRERVTVLNQTPGSFARLLAEDPAGSAFTALRYVVFGGERLRPAMLRQWIERGSGTRFVNMYGITETTVHVTFHEITARDTAEDASVIGGPIPTTTVHLLDPVSGRRLVPAGAVGEIAVGGAGVAGGYLNRPELTEARFVPDPFAGAGRLFRSGDLARWRPDGTLEYIGRGDSQVKIRGYRVELGEIESRLREHAAVDEAVVLLEPGVERLTAFIRPGGRAPAEAELRAHAAALLPEHMVPAEFRLIERIPLTANGKIDTGALLALAPRTARAAESGPRTATARVLAEIWCAVLRIETVGADDSFFELGGHSLLAGKVATRLAERLGVRLPLRDVFECPRLQDLADRIDARAAVGGRGAGAELPGPGEALVPASGFQERLWLAGQVAGTGTAYNMPMMWRIRGRLDPDRLRAALRAVVARHEILRTRFAEVEGRLTQIVGKPWEPETEYEDLRAAALAPAERMRRVEDRLRFEARRHLDPASGRLLRAVLLDFADDDQTLFLCTHHLVSDADSVRLLMADLAACYRNAEAELGPARQYREFADASRRDVSGSPGLDFWARRLAGAPASSALPAVATPEQDGAAVIPLAPDVLDRLRELSAQRRVSWFMLVASAVAVMLHRWTGALDVTFGCPVEERAGFEDVIGPCLNTVVLRSRIEPGASVADVVTGLRDMILDALEHQDVPFEDVVARLDPPRTPGRTPFVDVCVNASVVPPDAITLGAGTEAEQLWLDAQWQFETKFALTASLLVIDGRLRGWLSHRGDRYAAADTDRMARWLGEMLDGFERHLGEPVFSARQPVRSPAAAPSVRQFRDFTAANEREWADSPELEFWAARLAGAPASTALPETGRPGPHGAVPIPLGPQGLRRLRPVLAEHRVSWFTVAASAVAAMLHRWSGSDDVVFGVPIENREGFEDVIGPCLNTVVLRSRIAAGATVGDVLAGMRGTVLEAFDHQAVPFDAVVDRLNPPRVSGRTPYLDVVLAVSAAPAEPPRIGPAVLTGMSADVSGADYTAKFGLTVEVKEASGRLYGTVAYRGDRHPAEQVEQMAAWLGALLEDFGARLSQPVHDQQDPGARAQPGLVPGTLAPGGNTPSRQGADELEERVGKVWAAVLRLPEVGPEDNFFDLGGNSRRLGVLHARLTAELGASLPLRALFDYPTVRAMARALGGGPAGAEDAPAAAEDAQARAARARQARAARRPPRT